MAYKSLYRKYRPTVFEEVCGQSYIVTTLNHALENNKISHAYLFTGTRGTGKTTIAKIFAKSVNCLNKKDNLPCGKCEVCTCTNTDEIPDIIEIDAASNNGVDEIRELKNKIKLMPVMCKYKVYIIDEVHMLSTGAFNALLKTLEEPPEHVIFILATTEPQKLPITIISRCQRFDFKRISNENICDRLRYIAEKENISIESDALMEIAKLSGGALRDAIGLLDQLSSYDVKKITIDDIYELKGSVSSSTLIKLVKLYVNRNIPEMLDLIDDIYNAGKNFSLLSEDMLMLFRNVYIYKIAPKYFKGLKTSNEKEIIEIADLLDSNSIEKIIEKIEKLTVSIKESNYARVIFEVNLLSDFNEKVDNKEVVKKEKVVIENKTEKQVVKEEKIDVNVTNEIKKEVIKASVTTNKDVLINNTIALASNICKKEMKESFLSLDKYLISKKYKNEATILKDSNITAVSEDHLLLTYKYSSMVDMFDEDIENISNLIEKMVNKRYKIVSITDSEWKEKRPYYVEMKKQNGEIKLLEEKQEIEDEKKIKIDSNYDTLDNYIDMFGSELIEMEG